MTIRTLGAATVALALSVSMAHAAKPTRLPQLKSAASITRDVDGIAHVKASNEQDMFFLQAWVHAQDRLFQADVNRRQPSGTLAELLGPGALPSDVQLRTLGLRRSAERTWMAMQAEAAAGDPQARGAKEAMEAYADGFNAYLEQGSALPPEYAALGLTAVEPWTPVDSIVIGKLIAFGLSFDLEDIDNTVTLGAFQAVLGSTNGYLLFAEDLYRSAPFDPAATVPDSGGSSPVKPPAGNGPGNKRSAGVPVMQSKAASMGKSYLAKARQVPLLKTILENDKASRGSNNWGVTRAASATGNPIIANDPHLSLDHPTTFYPMHLSSPNYDAVGNGFAGAPFIITGQNRFIAWGPTTNPMDVTDVFFDVVVPDPTSPSGLSIQLPGGELGPIVPIPESYSANIGGNVEPVPPNPGIPAVTLTVPARYNGVILDFDGDFANGGTALTAQFTGFGATRELESFYLWNLARNLTDFRRGLEKFDFGSQNWAYADKWGNLGYFTSAEMPIRTDLQILGEPAGGVPPYFIRQGSLDLHQWLPVQTPYPGQVTPYEILSPAEMPQVVNPANGYFVNANNDPAGNTLDNNVLNEQRPGGGVYYLNPGYASGFRAGSITERVQRALSTGDQKLSVAEMADIQADVGLLDAEFFAPLIVAAYESGQSTADPVLAAAAQDPRLAEAANRLTGWAELDYQAKTGISEGYDAEDVDGEPSGSLDDDEIAASVATTIYSVWRSSFIKATIDQGLAGVGLNSYAPGSSLAVTALRQLVENGGVSASGLDFFDAGAADQATDVQVLMLQSLSDALDRLAGPEYADAFAQSSDQNDYRWGLLHRIVMDSPLGQPFSVPEAFGLFSSPLKAALPGLPTDGGFGTPDVASHSARASGVNGFMFGSGPTNRWVSDVPRSGPYSQSVWPGGTSAVPGDDFYIFPMLPRWLTNDAKPIRFKSGDIKQGSFSEQKFKP